jgi:pilus assembly protein CpaB
MRATAFAIAPDSAVAGFILPNDRVDVVLTRELQIAEGGVTAPRVVSSTVLENVRVLAIDQNLNQSNESSSMTGATATVELTAEDAEKLRLADRLGDLSLLLRSYADNAGPTLARVDSPAFVQPRPVSAQAAPAPAAVPTTNAPVGASASPRPPADTAAAVKIYRGGQ